MQLLSVYVLGMCVLCMGVCTGVCVDCACLRFGFRTHISEIDRSLLFFDTPRCHSNSPQRVVLIEKQSCYKYIRVL